MNSHIANHWWWWLSFACAFAVALAQTIKGRLKIRIRLSKIQTFQTLPGTCASWCCWWWWSSWRWRHTCWLTGLSHFTSFGLLPAEGSENCRDYLLDHQLLRQHHQQDIPVLLMAFSSLLFSNGLRLIINCNDILKNQV